ncbi:MAG: DNA-directed RNA polymerase subunit alpha [Phycisphaeraceae bacterium]|nr:DNA-directed RNA polymerase subunit alpha [Phycisphaeraceae bacterium]
MHVRWRGLELPARVEIDRASRTRTFSRFIVEPFERGFGTTVGNALRRILLSSVEGSAVIRARITGVEHEFSTLPGVAEDVTDIILNMKGLVVSLDGDEQRTLRLAATGPGDVTADLIEADTRVEIHNPDHVIATLTAEVDFECEMTVAKGRGYQPASAQLEGAEEMEIGVIPIDAVFSPVQRVRYRVEDTRVGQKTNFDRLILDVWTNETCTPEMVVVEAAKILRKHLNPFVMLSELGDFRVTAEASIRSSVDDDLVRKLNMRIEDLDLSVRALNCLSSAHVRTVADLVRQEEQALLSVRSFGRTSLREVKRKLEEMGLSLGMALPEGVDLTPTGD